MFPIRRAFALRLIDQNKESGVCSPEGSQLDNMVVLKDMLKAQWNHPEAADLTNDKVRSSLRSLKDIECPDPTSCSDHCTQRERDFTGTNFFKGTMLQ